MVLALSEFTQGWIVGVIHAVLFLGSISYGRWYDRMYRQ